MSEDNSIRGPCSLYTIVQALTFSRVLTNPSIRERAPQSYDQSLHNTGTLSTTTQTRSHSNPISLDRFRGKRREGLPFLTAVWARDGPIIPRNGP